jgi:hypothetical protein
MIESVCPACYTVSEFPDPMDGQQGRCPTCRGHFPVVDPRPRPIPTTGRRGFDVLSLALLAIGLLLFRLQQYVLGGVLIGLMFAVAGMAGKGNRPPPKVR